MQNGRCVAQDVEFSQYFHAPVYMNPALAGTSYGPKVNLNYRNQWPGYNKAFISTAVSFDQYSPKLHGGIGLNMVFDRAGNGVYNTFRISGAYAYQVSSDKLSIRIGIEPGFQQKTLKTNDLTFADMINPIYGFTDENGVANATLEIIPDANTVQYFDFGAGASIMNDNFYLGFAARHLTVPNESFRDEAIVELPMRFSGHGGWIKEFNKQGNYVSYFSPNFMFVNQGKFNQLNAGATISVSYFSLGAYFRHTFSNSDALIMMLGVEYKFVKAVYSYDITMSKAGNGANASELSLVFDFKESNKVTKRRWLKDSQKCPAIFQ